MEMNETTAMARFRRSHTVVKNAPPLERVALGTGEAAGLGGFIKHARAWPIRIMCREHTGYGDFHPAWHVRSVEYSVQSTPRQRGLWRLITESERGRNAV